MINSRKALFFAAAFFLLASRYASPEDAINIPAPKQGVLVESRSITFGGRPMEALSYETTEEPAVVFDYYKDFFLKNGYKDLGAGITDYFKNFLKDKNSPPEALNLIDQEYSKLNLKTARFSKENEVIDFIVMKNAKDNKTKAAVLKYTQNPGEAPLEQMRPSVKDNLFALPKEDVPGSDLIIVSRPPKSVRLASVVRGNSSAATYSTELVPDEARDFYKTQLALSGWKIDYDTVAGDAFDKYKKLSGQEAMGNIPQIFSDGEDLNQIIRESYQLSFKGSSGILKVSIMPNMIDRKAGSIVNIQYYESSI